LTDRSKESYPPDFNPGAPAEVLPLAKPPYFPAAYMLIAGTNLVLSKNAPLCSAHKESP